MALTQHTNTSAAHRNYPRQFGGGSSCIVLVLRQKQWMDDFRYEVGAQHAAPLLDDWQCIYETDI